MRLGIRLGMRLGIRLGIRLGMFRPPFCPIYRLFLAKRLLLASFGLKTGVAELTVVA